jgi:hypothetical protein
LILLRQHDHQLIEIQSDDTLILGVFGILECTKFICISKGHETPDWTKLIKLDVAASLENLFSLIGKLCNNSEAYNSELLDLLGDSTTT